MNSLLFDLISKAGSASLGELSARSSFTPETLALEIAKMLRNGDVTLSKPTNVPPVESAAVQAAVRQNRALEEVIALMDNPRKLVELVESDTGLFVQGIESALRNESAAESINVNPTSKGFRFNVA